MSNLQNAIEFITHQRDKAQGVLDHHEQQNWDPRGVVALLRFSMQDQIDDHNNVLAVLATIKPKPQTWQEDH